MTAALSMRPGSSCEHTTQRSANQTTQHSALGTATQLTVLKLRLSARPRHSTPAALRSLLYCCLRATSAAVIQQRAASQHVMAGRSSSSATPCAAADTSALCTLGPALPMTSRHSASAAAARLFTAGAPWVLWYCSSCRHTGSSLGSCTAPHTEETEPGMVRVGGICGWAGLQITDTTNLQGV